jgi:taurine dehydrogenase small subunit
MVEDAKLNALERMLDGFNRHDLDTIMSLFIEDCVFESPTRTMVGGERLEVRGCDLWTFQGEEIVLKDSYWKIVEP